MPMFAFGSGTLWGIRTDVANSTPVQFGTLQEVQYDNSGTNKPLYGQNQFPDAVARGQQTIDLKAKLGQIDGRLYSDLYFGAAMSSGQTTTANGEAALVPAAAPYTVAVANGATFQQDLGVVNAATGVRLQRVAAAPATGEYSVTNAGVYTFAAADEGIAVAISYLYTVANTGQSFVITNQKQGIQPVFMAVLESGYNGASGLSKLVMQFNACVSSKLSLPTKQADWLITEFDFSAFADPGGNLGKMSFNQAA